MSDCYTSFANELGDLINNRDYKIIFDGCSGLPSIVFKKINEFDMEFLEGIILSIAKKELSAITKLGGVLGFIIGFIPAALSLI